MSVDIILFDLGDVLELCDDASWPQAWAEHWSHAAGVPLQTARERVRTHGPTPNSSEAQYEAAWQSALGVSDAVRHQMFVDLWDRYCGKPNQELFDYVRSLRSRVRLGVLSNSADGARREEERRFGLSALFDPIFYSHELGVGKPDPAIFALVLDRLGLPADRVGFVDNLDVNVAAAASAGMRAIHHTSNAGTMAAIEALLA